jgi:hypothetical protein
MLDANIAGAPVVNSAGRIVGVLTEADVIWKVCVAICVCPPYVLSLLAAPSRQPHRSMSHLAVFTTLFSAHIWPDRLPLLQLS